MNNYCAFTVVYVEQTFLFINLPDCCFTAWHTKQIANSQAILSKSGSNKVPLSNLRLSLGGEKTTSVIIAVGWDKFPCRGKAGRPIYHIWAGFVQSKLVHYCAVKFCCKRLYHFYPIALIFFIYFFCRASEKQQPVDTTVLNYYYYCVFWV